MAAAKPTAKVSHPRRIAAADSTSRLGIAVSVGSIPFTRPQQDLADPYVKANRAKDEHAPRLGLQPAIDQQTKHTAGNYPANQKKWQFCGERELARQLAGSVAWFLIGHGSNSVHRLNAKFLNKLSELN